MDSINFIIDRGNYTSTKKPKKTENFRRYSRFIFEHRSREKRLMSSLDRQLVSEREDTFTKIYLGNMWQSQESKSGTGSELASTENIVKKLPDLISELNIKSVFDAGCGDWNWFKEIDINFNYLGGDIVKPLIEELQKKHEKKNIKFVNTDVVQDKFNKFDLVISRNVLFHLSEKDIFKFLSNFVNSDSSYLLTTHSGDYLNNDIDAGSWRYLNLLDEPYNFSAPLFSIEDCKGETLGLWSNQQVWLALKAHLMKTENKHRLSEIYKINPSLELLINKIKADKKILKDKVKFVWLIGSYAKGIAKEDSDTDLLIVQHQDNIEDWKGELRYLSSFLPEVKLQAHQLLSEQWENIERKGSAFYRGVINKEDHIEIINNV